MKTVNKLSGKIKTISISEIKTKHYKCMGKCNVQKEQQKEQQKIHSINYINPSFDNLR